MRAAAAAAAVAVVAIGFLAWRYWRRNGGVGGDGDGDGDGMLGDDRDTSAQPEGQLALDDAVTVSAAEAGDLGAGAADSERNVE